MGFTLDQHEPMAARLQHFEMSERVDGDGAVRLQLKGELDIAASDRVNARLRELQSAGTPTTLDLSELVFIDSTGFQTLYASVRSAGQNGWELVIGDELTPQVKRMVALVDGNRLLWPARRADA
jgi:anti-anti-sigma factor